MPETMLWYHVIILSAVSLFTGSDGRFSPNITVISCASQRVVVMVENAADGGLIFIQGRGLSCSQTTISETRSYEFDFELCNIEYDTKFRVVVQKKTQYQTGYDKVIPVMCIVDTSDLFVSSVVFPEEKLDSDSVNRTIRPSVSMRILAPETAVSVEEVSLNDEVLMSLRLDDPFLEDFDIKAKDCRAELINLVQDECSADEDLFPNFERKSKGDVASTFQAFQPTNMDGQTEVDVAFTCTVAVCKGECHKDKEASKKFSENTKKLCGQIVGWGRKKREDEEDEDDIYEKVTCGTKLKVKSPEQGFIEGVTSEFKGQLCAEKVAVVSILAVTVLTIIVSWIVCACVTSKLRRISRMTDGPDKPSTLRRLSEKNINFARSVGRRLSNMLNLPVGYDMRDPKMMQECIPEAEPSPTMNRRRDSVTVSTDIDTDSIPYDNEEIFRTTSTSSPIMLRKRFVDSGVQTDSDYSTLISPKQQNIKRSPVNFRKHPFGFITSISIKSGLSKPKTDPTKVTTSNMQTNETPNTISSSKSGFVNGAMDNTIIQYSAFNVPKVRNAGQPLKENTLKDESPVNCYANNREPSLNDGSDDDFNMVPFENVKSDNERSKKRQPTLVHNNESHDIYIVDEVIPDPIEFVETHKLERKSSTHV